MALSLFPKLLRPAKLVTIAISRRSEREREIVFIEWICLYYDGNFLFIVSIEFSPILFMYTGYRLRCPLFTEREWYQFLPTYQLHSDECPCTYGECVTTRIESFIWRDHCMNHFSVFIIARHVRENKCKLVSSDYDAVSASACSSSSSFYGL